MLLTFLTITSNAEADSNMALGDERVKFNLGSFIVNFRTGGEVTVNNFDIDVNIDSDDWDGHTDLDYGGLQAYVFARF